MATKKRQLLTSDDAVIGKVQHKNPCSDCPWSRDSIPGWLGGSSTEDWVKVAHSDSLSFCHVIHNQQCAGLAIYRRNVCKQVIPPLLELPADKKKVFGFPTEFVEHHAGKDGLQKFLDKFKN